MISASEYYRIYGIINGLERRHTASDLGRICQCLLALTFKERDFRISNFQLSGRPDFCAQRGTESYALEVKSPTTAEVLLKEEDLSGISQLGMIPIIAVLTYPELECRWILADAEAIPAKKMPKTYLKKFSKLRLESEINASFLQILEKYKDYANVGVDSLREILETG